jgi:hypothetical protein
MTYDAEVEQVTYRSDEAEGPTAGTATVDGQRSGTGRTDG